MDARVLQCGIGTTARRLTAALLTAAALTLATPPGAVGDPQTSADDADYRDFEPAPYQLGEDEAERIKRQVLRRCALSESVADNPLPWYFHYEYGLELVAAGDPQRGLEALILAANLRTESKRNTRMYGMWYTHYLPYFQIAQAHSRLGNWRCAMDAMRLSARYGEFSPADNGYREYSDLQQLIMRHTEDS